jgi:LuxR family maltose regulon positive regulatory protein
MAQLDRFCAPLSQSICRGACGDSPCMYEARENNSTREIWSPLCIPLDTRNEWYRFHHLFQKLLRQQFDKRLSPPEVREVFHRAMVWTEENGYIEEAILYALKAGEEHAVDLVVRHRHQAMNREQWGRLRHWLNQFSEEQVEQTPDLLLLRAWCSVGYPEMFELFGPIDALLDALPEESTEQLRGELLAYRALQHYAGADAQNTVSAAEEALRLLDPAQLSERGFAYILFALGKQMQGRFTEGRNAVLNALNDRSIYQTTCHSRLLAALCFTYWMEGDHAKLAESAKEYRKLGDGLGFSETIQHSHYFSGLNHYARNELDEAGEHFARVAGNPEISNLHNYLHSTYALAMTRQAQGREPEARQLVQHAVSHAFENQNPSMLLQTEAFEAELALRQGRLAEAEDWMNKFEPPAYRALWRFYVPDFTCVRILLAQDTAASAREAARLSVELCDMTRSIHNRHFHITALTLHALALDRLDQRGDALTVLDRAVRLSQPGGQLRCYLDEDPQVLVLLNQLDLEKESLHYVARILAAAKHNAAEKPNPAAGKLQNLMDPLSRRERDVLVLMAESLDNRKIASRLFISPGTVKRHTHSIYSKLAVHSRLDAVTKARGLGLLDS